MTESDYDALVKALPKLSGYELQKLSNLAENMALKKTKVKTGGRDMEKLVFHLIREELDGPPIQVLQKHSGYSRLKNGAAEAGKFVEKHLPKKCRKTQRLKALQTLIRAAISENQRMDIPNTPLTIGDRLQEIGGLVDRQLPGYTEAGLLTQVLIGGKIR